MIALIRRKFKLIGKEVLKNWSNHEIHPNNPITKAYSFSI